jgi:hypothetical protein
LVVLTISRSEEALGARVPIPALPVPGKVLVWLNANGMANRKQKRNNADFISWFLV